MSNITFTIPKADLFNECSLMSAYMAKNVSLASGNMDDYCMSSDEEDVFSVCLNNALPDIYEAVIKITPSAGSSFVVGTNITITVVDNGAFNANVQTMVGDSIKKCLKYGVLKEFYTICLHPELYKISADNLISELFKLKQRLFQMKKHSITSSNAVAGGTQ